LLTALDCRAIARAVFTLKGVMALLGPLLAKKSIKAAHQHHMNALKEFAEHV
jgi:hypothetical protein